MTVACCATSSKSQYRGVVRPVHCCSTAERCLSKERAVYGRHKKRLACSGQKYKIVCGHRRLLGEQLDGEVAARRMKRRLIVLVRVDLHRWGAVVLLRHGIPPW